ncbi:2-amino-4-hydroxy-6-hydroxymethyldihydropteridine diphosphokinase [Persephonella sp.]
MEKVFIGLGSNIGDRESFIRRAIEYMSIKITDIKQAPIFISRAVGFTDQPDFYNTVISGYTDMSPEELLTFLKETEQKVGRIKRFRWGPREIDIDILLYGNQVIEENGLVIPHPRLHERDFVLQPMVYLQPDLIHPLLKKTMAELLNNLKDRSIIGVIHSR